MGKIVPRKFKISKAGPAGMLGAAKLIQRQGSGANNAAAHAFAARGSGGGGGAGGGGRAGDGGVAQPGGPSLVNAVSFDGTNDFLNKSGTLAGATENTKALVSFWFDIQGGDGTDRIFWTGQGTRNRTLITNANKIVGRFENVSTNRWNYDLATTFLAAEGWHHFLLSCDLNGTTNLRKIFIDDVEETLTQDDIIAGPLDWDATDWAIGAFFNGTLKFPLDCADFYITNEFLDLTVEANRRKFIDAAGKPVDLGADGSTPTGTKPLMFFSGPTVDWHTNKGSGGGFTENGALTDAASSPSD